MINPNDIKIEVIENKVITGGQQIVSSDDGPKATYGKQVLTMNNGIRITYIPTGVVVECKSNISKSQNEQEALKILESVLNESYDLWLYSENEENFYGETFYTKESAIEAALEDENIGEVFYVGKQSQVNISGVNVSTILEDVAENTAQGFDGFGDDYLEDVKGEHMRELEDALDEVLFKWIEKYNYKPDWYEIVDIEMIRR